MLLNFRISTSLLLLIIDCSFVYYLWRHAIELLQFWEVLHAFAEEGDRIRRQPLRPWHLRQHSYRNVPVADEAQEFIRCQWYLYDFVKSFSFCHFYLGVNHLALFKDFARVVHLSFLNISASLVQFSLPLRFGPLFLQRHAHQSVPAFVWQIVYSGIAVVYFFEHLVLVCLDMLIRLLQARFLKYPGHLNNFFFVFYEVLDLLIFIIGIEVLLAPLPEHGSIFA